MSFPLEFERPLSGGPGDETDVNLRSYFCRMPDARIREYDPGWSDEQLMHWDGNFRCDGVLFLVCSERDVEVAEYRRVLEEHRARRGLEES